MDAKAVEDRLFKTTRKFGKLVGAWPFMATKGKNYRRLFMVVYLMSSLVTQIANVVCFFSIDVLIEQVIYMGAAVGIAIKLGNQIFNEQKFKRLLRGFFRDWEAIKSKDELAIMLKYADRGTLFTNLYLVTAYTTWFMFTQVPHVINFVDYLSKRNESRELLLVYPAYYFVDGEKYYYIIMAHMTAGIYLVVLVYVCCDGYYMCLVQHACGLLAVAGFVEEVEKAHEICFLVSLVFIVAAFCLTLVKASSLDMSPLFVKYAFFLIVQLIHLLFLTIQGQFVMNAGEEVYNWIYEGLWYNTDPKLQALYVLALRGSLVTPVLTAGGLIVLNLPTFAEVVKVSVSYYTVLHTT